MAKPVVFLFDGQGAFKPGVGKDLCARYPAARRVVAAASAVLGYDLTEHLWGDAAATTSRSTSLAQPAISAVSLAYAEVLAEHGVEAEVSLGHSLGEATALVNAGALDRPAGIAMIQERGRLMEKGGKQGAMMAIVNVPLAALEKECARVSAETGMPVVVANINAPNQVVISGAAESVSQMAAFANAQRGRGIPLDVGGAWHSPFLEGVAAEFRDYLDGLQFRDPRLGFYSVVEQKVLKQGSAIQQAFARQMLMPVNWVEAIENLVALGYRTFVEVGPSRILKDLVAKIAPDVSVESTALHTDLSHLAQTLRD